jgi:hypothetical protein
MQIAFYVGKWNVAEKPILLSQGTIAVKNNWDSMLM